MKKNTIQFVSTIPGLDKIDECLPRPAKHFIPEWFKNTPITHKSVDDSGQINILNTVKICPSFPDYFSQGYIVPMWMDSIIKYDSSKDQYLYSGSNLVPNWDVHPNNQFLSYAKQANHQGSSANFVFKANCPWRIITPPGYSVLQLPLFYNFENDFSVLPGIVDTDIHHEINQQVLYHKNNEDVFIKRGQPFVMYVPFKREKYDYVVRSLTKEDDDLFLAQSLNLNTKFTGSGVYRSLQRKRDKFKNK
jgi:hypothetical protein